MEILDITPFEDEYVEQSMVEPSVYNDSIINLISLRKCKLREKFRLALQNGVPIPNSYLFTHHFRNNKNSIWLYFKLQEDNTAEKTTCVQKCINMIPKMVTRSQMRIVKNSLNKMQNMKFAKNLSKINYMISTVSESLNTTIKIDKNYKEEIKRELLLLSELEYQNLLQDSILGNKVIYGGETKFKDFIKKMNNEINNDLYAHSRRAINKVYCARWISI